MNLFLFHPDPDTSTIQTCDAHIRKGILELSQMLCYRHIKEPHFVYEALYVRIPKSAQNHPMTQWVNSTDENYAFTLYMLLSYIIEHKYRFNKHHLYLGLYKRLNLAFGKNISRRPSRYIIVRKGQPVDFAFTIDFACQAYREYFIKEKQHLAKWTNRPVPVWYQQSSLFPNNSIES